MLSNDIANVYNGAVVCLCFAGRTYIQFLDEPFLHYRISLLKIMPKNYYQQDWNPLQLGKTRKKNHWITNKYLTNFFYFIHSDVYFIYFFVTNFIFLIYAFKRRILEFSFSLNMCWADPIDLSGFKTGGSTDLRQALTPSQILDCR